MSSPAWQVIETRTNMNKPQKFPGGKIFFLIILIFLLVTDTAILLDIPVLRQVLGFLLLSILPGLLILYLLRLNKLELATKAVLTVGLSTAFLMLFGLLFDQALFVIGYTTPLSTTPLVIGFSVILLIMCLIAYKTNREAFSPSFSDFKLNTADKAFLVLPAIFLLLSIYGMYLMNATGNNMLLLVLLFLIPAYAILMAFQRYQITANTYPIAIVMISFALLSMFWLRSEHILGHDIHHEYYLFQMTLANSHWRVFEHSTLDSCLSISLLPAIYQSLLNVNATEYLFKGIYVVICTFTPLSVYMISRKYLGNLYAFLAALFFISQAAFLSTAGSPRTNLAIFLFALAIMVLFQFKITTVNRRALFITFMLATVVSHYTTTYIFFILLIATYLLSMIFRKYTPSRNITFISISLFLVVIFFWYLQMTGAPFISGTRFAEETVSNLQTPVVEEARHPELSLLFGKGLATRILGPVNLAIHWLSFAFIGLGVIGTLLTRGVMTSASKQTNSTPGFLKAKFEMEYLFLALGCAGMLIAMVALPYVSIAYGMHRLYSQTAVILSVFFVLGGILLSKYVKANPRLLVLLILVPYFLFTTGTVNEVSGIHTDMLLSPKATGLDYELVHAQETRAAGWLKEHMEQDPQIYTADMFGRQWLVSQGKISWRLVDGRSFSRQEEINGYLCLSYNNVVNDKLVISGRGERTEHDMSEYTNRFVGKNKLYANGGSEIWR